ncbi:MAG: DUF512 domain-containing protein, partial [Firmicutes bacterium]|nr:DUF512 domain-containing protein [Bacillota bacterium]
NSGIVVHAQIVYCPTYNEDYQKTIQDLSQYCMSVAIVPVGLTNDCNKDLHPVTKEIACRLIAEIGVLQQQFLETQKRRFAYLADEIYVTAGVALPNPLEYDHFEQTGNGVGLMAQFDIEVQDALQNVTAQKTPPYKYTIVTGMASYQYFCDLQKRLVQRGLSVEVKGVVNHYFGNRVTVAGLVTGSDIVKAYEGHTFDKNERLLLPKNMLKEFGDVFLDDMSLQQLQDLLGVQIEMVQVDGHALIEKLQS